MKDETSVLFVVKKHNKRAWAIKIYTKPLNEDNSAYKEVRDIGGTFYETAFFRAWEYVRDNWGESVYLRVDDHEAISEDANTSTEKLVEALKIPHYNKRYKEMSTPITTDLKMLLYLLVGTANVGIEKMPMDATDRTLRERGPQAINNLEKVLRTHGIGAESEAICRGGIALLKRYVEQ